MEKYVTDKKVEEKFGAIQRAMDAGEYDIVVKECGGLFETAFKKIFQEAVTLFGFKERNELLEKEKEKGEGKKGVDAFGFGELVGLFRETELMKKWAAISQRDIGLIENVNYAPIVKLRNDLVHHGGRCGKSDAELVFQYLKALYTAMGMTNIEEICHKAHNPVVIAEAPGNQRERANIILDRERGIILNEADNTRNMSCKVETINRMLSVAYKNTKELVGEEAAEKLLYDMGYDSGSAFGRVMYERWDIEKNDISVKEKLDEWCEFDSVVGWGRFRNNIEIDGYKRTLEGNLEISENFLCHKRKRNDVPICGFMKGYCDGVITELLGGLDVNISCDEGQCPLRNALMRVCKFNVTVTGWQ